MKTHKKHRLSALAPLVVAPFLATAAEDAISRVKLEEPKRNTDRFSVSYSAAWNINAKFSGIAYGAGRNPRGLSMVPGADRTYDDGYVRRDHFIDPNHLTANFGYRDESQVVSAPNGALVMHSTSANTTKSGDVTDDPQHGFQLTWNHELCRDKDDCWRWGIEGAFGWNDVQLNDSRPLAAGTKTITDTYAREVNPHEAPFWNPATETGHRGNFDSDAPFIANEVTHRAVTQNAGGAFVFGNREFDADLFFFHLGPYVEFPIADKLHAVISGGLAVGIMAGSYEFDETVVIPRSSVTHTRTDKDETDGLIGGYISATLLYNIDNNWGVFVGGQLQSMTDYTINANGRKATIDMGLTPFLTAGVSYSF